MTKPILLIEDEENDVFFMRRALKQAAVANPLVVIEHGQKALDYLQGTGPFGDREQFPLPCLILLDLKLPHVPGLEVLQWIRSQPSLQTILVVVLTSSNLDDDIDRAYRLGANSYLVKPASPEGLLEIVKAVGDYWLKRNQPPPLVFESTRVGR